MLPGSSDHHLLTYTINSSPKHQPNPPRVIHQFNKADVDQLKQAARDCSTEFLLSDPEKRSLESNWTMISKFLNRCLTELIPSKMSKGRSHLPWITQDIKQKLRKRDILFKKARRQDNTAAWEDFKRFRNQVAHDDYINNVIGASLKDNPKTFWSYQKMPYRTDWNNFLTHCYKTMFRSCRQGRGIKQLLPHHVYPRKYTVLTIKGPVSLFVHRASTCLSTTTQLSSAVHDWSFILQNRSQVDTILLDFQKAFDRVPHQRLRIKLQYYGIAVDTLNCIIR